MESNKKGKEFCYKKRPTIGFVVDRINEVGGYQSTLWNGISEAAAEKDFNVICFTGGQLEQSSEGKHRLVTNPIYDLISKQNVDGLVICSTAMGSEVGLENIASFFGHFSGLPVVSIGVIIKGIPSLVVDNEAGICSAVSHLVEHHGKRQIAFIRGPLGNIDADQRLNGFRNEINRFGIELKPQLILQGNFHRSSGKKAVENLLNLKDIEFDAIISSSDDMAIGAMEELLTRNIQVPDDIALIGFDDVEDAKTTLPPLTTVKQPLYDIGRQAVDMIEAQIKGEAVDEQKIFPTELIIRQTCGCGFDLGKSVLRVVELFNERDENSERKYQRIMIEAFNDSKFGSGDFSNDAILLLKAFEETLEDPERISNLLNIVFRIARNIYAKTEIEPSWYRIMAVLSDYAIEHADSQEKLLSNTSICNAAWEVFGKISWLSTTSYRLKNERKTEPLRQMSDSLVSTFDVSFLMNTMTSILSDLGVRQCWISVFDRPDKGLNQAKLILGYDEVRSIKIMSDKLPYPARQLIPVQYGNSEESYNLIVIPLKFKEKIFGFSIFGMDIRDLSVYELLSTQISTAYQGAKVVEKLKQTQEKLREQANMDILTQIYNRRYFLGFTNTTFTSALRYGRQLSLLLIDLDNFKSINDHFGHNKGDSILRIFAQIFKKNVRAPDILARYGGDEFIIVMPETNKQDALICANRLRSLVEKKNFGIKDNLSKLTVSIGVACLNHKTDKSLNKLIERADKALYQAKLEKNTVFHFD